VHLVRLFSPSGWTATPKSPTFAGLCLVDEMR
jgi:hypothetical protein